MEIRGLPWGLLNIRDDRELRGGLTIIPHASEELETKFNGILEGLGLRGWTVIWKPDKTQPKGRIQPETKIILIHDEKSEDALETLLHEFIEIKLRPTQKPLRSLVNVLIEWVDLQVYEAKEKAIEEFLPFLLKFIDDMYPSDEDLKKHRIANRG